MTTTTRADELATAAIDMLKDSAQMTSITAQDTCVRSAHVFATLAIDARLAELVEEQRTANKIAAYRAELIVNPYGVGTHEHDKWWVDFGTPITEAVQR